jgi:hypothetical protein
MVEKEVRNSIVFPEIRVLAPFTSACVGDSVVFTAAFETHAYKYRYVE